MDFDKPKVYGDTSITDGLVGISMIIVMIMIIAMIVAVIMLKRLDRTLLQGELLS